MYEHIIDKDELFDTYDYKFKKEDNNEYTYTLRYFKYYELMSVTNFIADYFPHLSDIYYDKPFETTNEETQIDGLHTYQASNFAPPDHLICLLSRIDRMYASDCHKKLNSLGSSRKDIICNLVNDSYVKQLSIIFDTYTTFQGIRDNVFKNETVKYKQLVSSFNSGLMYNYDVKNTIIYDLYSFANYLNSENLALKETEDIDKSKILLYYNDVIIDLVTKDDYLEELDFIVNKFSLRDIMVDLRSTLSKDKKMIYPEYYSDNITNNGTELYAQNKVHNLDRYES